MILFVALFQMFFLSTPFYNLYSFHSFYIFYSFVAYLPSFNTLSMCLYYAYSTFKLNTIYLYLFSVPPPDKYGTRLFFKSGSGRRTAAHTRQVKSKNTFGPVGTPQRGRPRGQETNNKLVVFFFLNTIYQTPILNLWGSINTFTQTFTLLHIKPCRIFCAKSSLYI